MVYASHSLSYQTSMKISSFNLFRVEDPEDHLSHVDQEDLQKFLRDSLDWAFLALDAEEEFLIRCLHGIGRTRLAYEEVGLVLGYSPGVIKKIELKCFDKMRIQLGGASFYKSACLTL